MTHRTLKTKLGAAGLGLIACLLPIGPARAHDVDAQFQKMDTNGDGKISREEHAAGAKAMFNEMDTNGDGKVTAAEMEAYHTRMESTHSKIEARDPGQTDRADRSEASAADKIKIMDTNGDGVLSADEDAAGAREMFDKMDTDHDGHLTKAEVKAGHARWMSKAHAAR